jgi:hypothetical protein
MSFEDQKSPVSNTVDGAACQLEDSGDKRYDEEMERVLNERLSKTSQDIMIDGEERDIREVSKQRL